MATLKAMGILAMYVFAMGLIPLGLGFIPWRKFDLYIGQAGKRALRRVGGTICVGSFAVWILALKIVELSVWLRLYWPEIAATLG